MPNCLSRGMDFPQKAIIMLCKVGGILFVCVVGKQAARTKAKWWRQAAFEAPPPLGEVINEA